MLLSLEMRPLDLLNDVCSCRASSVALNNAHQVLCFNRAMLTERERERESRYCHGKSSVCPSVTFSTVVIIVSVT